ncbi:MAG: cytochrome-c oxidase, cbb3-type subunit III [PS1 clade bacterium]|jgi:cytochrome c oxidase cbb3-type subunit 3
MADLPFFWQTWVVGLIILGLVFLAVLVVRVYFEKDDHDEVVIWDNDLVEGSAPAPFWWFWLITSALIFSVLYMIFYPSFGNYNGLFNLTMEERYSESKADINDKYYKKLTTLNSLDMESLQSSQDAMHLAGNIYAQNCAACHGKDAKGQDVFPNLTDDDWLWGDKPEQIKHSISFGRNAVMPAWGGPLGEEGTTKMAEYIKSISSKTDDDEKHASSKQKYQMFCLGCHGLAKQGNVMLGAPNLADDIWLYGDDIESIKKTIASGRRGVMPAHKDRLSDLQIKLLTAWLKRN